MMDFSDTDHLQGEEDAEANLDIPVAHLAALNGDTGTLMQAIRNDPSLLEQKDREGLTPLGHTVLAGQLDAMKLLVKMGAAINTQDYLGRTPLSMAAYQGWYDGTVFLLRNGAKQNICDKNGRIPLHTATYDTNTKCMEALLQSISQDEIDAQDAEGMTALHWACFHKRPEHVQLLLLGGASVYIQDVDGRTALHWAAQNGSVNCCELLLADSAGASMINHVDATGKSALHFTAAAGYPEVVKRLAAVINCDLEAEDPDERTALHWAAATGQHETVSTLLELGAEPNPVDTEGVTPLEYARQLGHQECVQVLEHHLGINHTSMSSDPPSGDDTPSLTNPNPKTRRNPFGFIADLFKTKKAKSSHDLSSGAFQNEAISNMLPHSSTVGAELDSDQGSELLLSGETSSKEGSISGAINTDNIQVTPRKKTEAEVIESLEKIHLSRTDNPAIVKCQQVDEAMMEPVLQESPKHVILQHCDVRRASADSVPNHSFLIRSPPPSLRREPGSPAHASFLSARCEVSPHQVAEDAAEILAIHRGSKSPLVTSHSVSALRQGLRATPLSPIENKGSQGGDNQLPMVRGGFERHRSLSTTDCEDTTSRKGHQRRPSSPSKLAPIKGPLPKTGTYPMVNKHLEAVKREPWGPNRSPTPPNWDHPLTHREPLTSQLSQESPSSKVAGKKKRRKSHPPSTHTTSHSFSCEKTAPSSLEHRPPAGQTDPSISNLQVDRSQERLALDKSIQGLLH